MDELNVNGQSYSKRELLADDKELIAKMKSLRPEGATEDDIEEMYEFSLQLIQYALQRGVNRKRREGKPLDDFDRAELDYIELEKQLNFPAFEYDESEFADEMEEAGKELLRMFSQL